MTPTMHTTGRQRLLAALHRGPAPGGRPVWLMRQAGRFLPEYREVRARVSFMELVHSPELCTTVALQPLARFDLDATIVFSDILVIPDALGLGLSFSPGDGPKFARSVRTDADVAALDWNGVHQRLDFAYQAVSQLRRAAPTHGLFGFAGAPWTLFCYMVQGEGGKFPEALAALDAAPERSARLLERLADLVADHILAQARAGADAVQVFDTWAGMLDKERYARFCIPGLRRIADRLRAADVPAVLFLRGAQDRIDQADAWGFPAISVDHTTSLAHVRSTMPGITTQGNVDPEVLFTGEDAITAAVRGVFEATGGAADHIYNLGHGLTPTTPVEGVAAMVRAVRALPG